MEHKSAEKSQGRLLVIDDNPLIRDVLGNLLKSSDYDVDTVADGRSALKLLESKNIDLIICDVMMPEMDGYQLYDLLHKSIDFTHIPFIFLSAMGSDEEVRRGEESGADAYIVKPFDPEKMLSLIKGRLKRGRKLKSHSIHKFDQFRDEVLRNLAHELRTPLVALTTGSELLKDKAIASDETKKNTVLDAILRGGQRFQKLINDFIELEKAQNGDAKREHGRTARSLLVGDWMNEYLRMKTEELKVLGFNLEISLKVRSSQVWVVEKHLREILDRLVSNAVKFSTDKKTIRIAVLLDGAQVKFAVTDYGIGMKEREGTEIIKPFEQFERDTYEQQGLGLGLPIVKKLAEVNSGQIDYFNNPEMSGTTFVLNLPLLKK